MTVDRCFSKCGPRNRFRRCRVPNGSTIIDPALTGIAGRTIANSSNVCPDLLLSQLTLCLALTRFISMPLRFLGPFLPLYCMSGVFHQTCDSAVRRMSRKHGPFGRSFDILTIFRILCVWPLLACKKGIARVVRACDARALRF